MSIGVQRADEGCDCDIYLTGTNAYLLSSELSKTLPLSFSEFTDFCGVEFASGKSVGVALGGVENH